MHRAPSSSGRSAGTNVTCKLHSSTVLNQGCVALRGWIRDMWRWIEAAHLLPVAARMMMKEEDEAVGPDREAMGAVRRDQKGGKEGGG